MKRFIQHASLTLALFVGIGTLTTHALKTRFGGGGGGGGSGVRSLTVTGGGASASGTTGDITLTVNPAQTSTAAVNVVATGTGPAPVTNMRYSSGTAGDSGTVGLTVVIQGTEAVVSLTPNIPNKGTVAVATGPIAGLNAFVSTASGRLDGLSASTSPFATFIATAGPKLDALTTSTQNVANQIASTNTAFNTRFSTITDSLRDTNGSNIVNTSSNPVHWDSLYGVPAGFADGTDDGAGGSSAQSSWAGGRATSTIDGAGQNTTGWGNVQATTGTFSKLVIDSAEGGAVGSTATTMTLWVSSSSHPGAPLTKLDIGLSSAQFFSAGTRLMLLSGTSSWFLGSVQSDSGTVRFDQWQTKFTSAPASGGGFWYMNSAGQTFLATVTPGSGGAGGGSGGGIALAYSSNTALPVGSTVAFQGNTMPDPGTSGNSTFTFVVPVAQPIGVQALKPSSTSVGGLGLTIDASSDTYQVIYGSSAETTGTGTFWLDSYYNGKPVYMEFDFAVSSTSAGTIDWSIQCMAMKYGADNNVASYAVAVTTTFASATRTGGHLNRVSVALNLDGAVAGEQVKFLLNRRNPAGTAPVDVRVYGRVAIVQRPRND